MEGPEGGSPQPLITGAKVHLAHARWLAASVTEQGLRQLRDAVADYARLARDRDRPPDRLIADLERCVELAAIGRLENDAYRRLALQVIRWAMDEYVQPGDTH